MIRYNLPFTSFTDTTEFRLFQQQCEGREGQKRVINFLKQTYFTGMRIIPAFTPLAVA